MDKIVLGFMADLLYLKGIISFEEFDAIQKTHNVNDLSDVFEKMMRGEYSAYRKGESYITYLDRAKTEFGDYA